METRLVFPLMSRIAKKVRVGGSPFGRARPTRIPKPLVTVSKYITSFALPSAGGAVAFRAIELVENLNLRLLLISKRTSASSARR